VRVRHGGPFFLTNLSTMTEEQILLGLKNGDHEADAEIRKLYLPILTHAAEELLGEAPEIEGIVDDAFLLLFDRRKDNFKTLDQIESLLRLNVTNGCSAHLRLITKIITKGKQ
jgi:hypothetical protein